jgi:hypothetical protein
VSIFSVLTGLLILYEGISVGSGLVSDSDYHFGTDVFEAKGGWAYRSRRDYVASSVIEGTPFLVGEQRVFLLPCVDGYDFLALAAL